MGFGGFAPIVQAILASQKRNQAGQALLGANPPPAATMATQAAQPVVQAQPGQSALPQNAQPNWFQSGLSATAGSRNPRSARSASGAQQFFSMLDAMSAPAKEGNLWAQALRALNTNPPPAGTPQFPTGQPYGSDQGFPGPPNEVGDDVPPPNQYAPYDQGMQIAPGSGPTPVLGPQAGMTQQQMQYGATAWNMVKHGQYLQKVIGAKENQPTLIEAFMQGRNMAPGLAYKAEMRQNAQTERVTMVKYLLDTGQPHLAEAFMRPMKDEEQQQLVAQHMNMLQQGTRLQRAQAGPYLKTFEAPGEVPAPEAGGAPILGLPGQNPLTGVLPVNRAAAPEEISQNFGQAMQDPMKSAAMLAAFGAATGQPVKPEVLQQEMQRNLQMRGFNMAQGLLQKYGILPGGQPGQQSVQQPSGPVQPPAQAPMPTTPTGQPKIFRQGPPPQRTQELENIVAGQAQSAGIPVPFAKGLIDTENAAWDPAVVNKQYGVHGGGGLMQLVPSTYKGYKGDEGNLFNPVNNVEAGMMHLVHLQQKYGDDWPRIAAAYQAGEGNIPETGPIPKVVDVKTKNGQVVRIYPAAYADKVMRATKAREAGEPAPQWTQPGVVPNAALAQGQQAGVLTPPEQNPAYQQVAQQEGAPGGLNPLQGLTLDIPGVGRMSFKDMIQGSAPAIVHRGLAQGGVAGGVGALDDLARAGMMPQGQDLAEIKKSLTTLAYLRARNQASAQGMNEAAAHTAALRQAAIDTHAYFDGDAVKDLADPAKLKAATAYADKTANLVAEGAYKTGATAPGLAAAERGIETQQHFANAIAQARGSLVASPADVEAGGQMEQAVNAINKLRDQFLKAKAQGGGPLGLVSGAGQRVAAGLKLAPETQAYDKMVDSTMQTLGQIGEAGNRISSEVLKGHAQNVPKITDSVYVADAWFNTMKQLATDHFFGRAVAKQTLNVPSGAAVSPQAPPGQEQVAPTGAPSLEERKRIFQGMQ